MKITLAKSAGFCFGVKRAVDTVYEQLEMSAAERQPIYTFGPIIHNEEVVHDLEEKGVTVLESVEELEERAAHGGTVIIRAHGVEKGISEKIKELGYTLVDATCPFVLQYIPFSQILPDIFLPLPGLRSQPYADQATSF